MTTDTRTILILDDREANRSYLATLLGARGYTTIEAEDGARGLDSVRTAHPDLVLADILMPRMDGYEFLRRVRTTPGISNTPVILLSAHYLESEARALAESFGVESIISKPIEPDAVLHAVERALQKAVATARAQTDRHGADNGFEQEHRRLLTDTLARKASQLEVANDRLRGLVSLGRRLASERDPRRLLSMFATAAGELVGAAYVLLTVLDDNGAAIHPPHTPDTAAPPAVPRVPTNEPGHFTLKHILANGQDPAVVGSISSSGVAGQLVSRHRDLSAPLVITDVAQAVRQETLPAALGIVAPPPMGIIVVPIATASRRYGLVMFGGVKVAVSAENTGSLAQSMGAVLGVAYENATRYEQIERHAARLQQEIVERRLAEERIARLNAELESRVAERTAELERSYSRLRQSERMASLGTLCAGLGHDMGNLLMPIRLRLDLIEETLLSPVADRLAAGLERMKGAAPSSTACVEHVRSIRECVRYLTDLTSGLRLLALDTDDGVKEPGATVISDWWTAVQPLMRSALPANIELEAALPARLPPVAIARHRLTQAVFNLVQNAGDAINAQPDARAKPYKVAVAAEIVEDRDHAAGGSAGANVFMRLSVSDNGPGMSNEVRRRAVEPFYTTKARALSTGLGLSLVHGIVHASRGRVEIESEPGQGTAISMWLPTAADEAAVERPSRDRPHAIVSLKEPRRRALVTSMLDLLGYEANDALDTDASAELEGEATALVSQRVWIADSKSASPEDVKRFLGGGGERRVVFLGDSAELADLPRCCLLGPQPSMADLRRRLKDLLGPKAAQRQLVLDAVN